MPIGTSNGETYEDEWEMLTAGLSADSTEPTESEKPVIAPKDTSIDGTGNYKKPVDMSNLNIVEKGFLKTLSGLEMLGVGGKTLNLYNDIVQRGRTSPITEGDFSKEELNHLKDIIEKKVSKTGETSGNISYPDYLGTSDGVIDSFRNILGGFKYKKTEEGSIEVEDTYDFNKVKAGLTSLDNNPVVQAIGGIINPIGLASQLGRKLNQDTFKKGVPVSIKIAN